MALVARYIGLDEILECYNEKSETAYFSLWDKTKQICQYNGDDKDEGEQILREEIERNIRRRYSNILMLCLHPEPLDRYKPNSEVIYNAAVRSFEPQQNEYSNQLGAIYPAQIQQQLNAMQSEIASLREQLNDDDDDDDEKPVPVSGVDKTIEGINTLLAHPAVANLLTVIFSAKQSQPTTTGPAPQNVRAVAGVDNDAEILHLFKVLEYKGVTVDHVRKLAAMEPQQIQTLLKFL